ncbi:monooxygenase [Purpureocillium lavendulum]|uniref:Monooxygenase n=1 Tax=Purpureocillium lavendulum TaxID=1247861 RepID=A0AB34FQ16_9HYPO|nr:monooxygenase [Purpureocillium lavendulum]
MASSGAGAARKPKRQSVAIVGTGLAGLTAAYLLRNDDDQRYDVTLFEQASSPADALSFDSASVAVRDDKTGVVERIDLPMRACAGGYYANLMRMYDYLGVPLHPVRFLFVFAKALASSAAAVSSPLGEAARPEEAGSAPGSYFVHASNLHQTPPPWPGSRGVFAHVFEILYLVVCQLWFSVACFLVPPATGDGGHDGETLADYLERVWLPRRYVSHYLLPLMSSVSTCDHADMLAFPASDVVNYKRLSHGQQHYAVCGGVHQVQSRLVRGMRDIRLGCRVVCVETGDGGVLVRWQRGAGEAEEERFDRVVLAVSPDVAARVFSPLSAALGKMPTRWVESSVLSPRPGAFSVTNADLSETCAHHRDDRSPSQVITFRSVFGDGAHTEALHAMPGGVLVSTLPLRSVEDKAVLKAAGFTRTLRTPASRAATRRVMGEGAASDGRAHWVNGEGGVWLAGSWCWDGMVLLEGCVVSAMRVADDLGVRIPWR